MTRIPAGDMSWEEEGSNGILNGEDLCVGRDNGRRHEEGQVQSLNTDLNCMERREPQGPDEEVDRVSGLVNPSEGTRSGPEPVRREARDNLSVAHVQGNTDRIRSESQDRTVTVAPSLGEENRPAEAAVGSAQMEKRGQPQCRTSFNATSGGGESSRAAKGMEAR